MRTTLQPLQILQILRILQPLLLLLVVDTADGFLMVNTDRCVYNSTDAETMQFIRSLIYNKLEIVRFDSDVGWYIGFTDFGIRTAERWNVDTALINLMRHEKYRYCAVNAQRYYPAIYSKSVEPYAVLNTAPSAGSERVLVCSVYGFYPKNIEVTWTNHGLPILSGVITSDLLSNADWTYQLHTKLEYTPRPGDHISCVIEHRSLKQPMVLNYGALSREDWIAVAVGASGLVLGLVWALAGFLFYKHKGPKAKM